MIVLIDNYDSFTSIVEKGENSCPPFICIPNSGLQISSGIISFQCDNSYSSIGVKCSGEDYLLTVNPNVCRYFIVNTAVVRVLPSRKG